MFDAQQIGAVAAVSSAICFLSFFSLLFLMEVLTMQKVIDNFLHWLIMGAVFFALAAVALYHYPNFDQFWYVSTGAPYYEQLTLYHPERFGVIHWPTIFLSAWLSAAAIVTPHVTTVIEWSIGGTTKRLVAEIRDDAHETATGSA
jgi:hypothetical protein